jgi:PKD repeat protein
MPAGGTVLNSFSLNFTPGLPGTYAATCTVTDADGSMGSASTPSITVTTVNPAVSITGTPNSSIPEGTAISLTAAATSPRTSDTFTYAWTIYRNSVAYTPATVSGATTYALNFTPDQPGTYTATCTVTDADSAVGSQTTSSITVTTVNPAVTISGTPVSSIAEGTAVNLAASATSPRTGDTYSYLWTISRNSVSYTPASVSGASTANLSFTPDRPGTYTATCTVTDADSAVGSQTTTSITVTTVNPAVTITTAPTTVTEGTAVNLTATATSPRVNDTFIYAWAIKLNGSAYTPTVVTGASTASLGFTPDQPGAYVATCTVTDLDSAVGTVSSTSIAVTKVNPVVTITTAPTTVTEGTAVNLTATATSPRVTDRFTYAWAIKLNGSAYTPSVVTGADTASLGFTPDQPGAYVATCTATDVDGGVGTVSTTSIAVTAVDPTVTISTAPTTTPEGTAVNLTATASSPRLNDTFSYAWTIMLNGSAYTPAVVTGASTASLSFTPDQPGNYAATCVVTDTDQEIGTASSTSITVTKVNPAVTITTAPTTVGEGTAINLTASATSRRINDTFSYSWSITLNGQAYTPSVVTGLNTAFLGYTPDQPGAYVATCTVTDLDSAIGTASASTTATAVNPVVTITGTPVSSIAEGTALSLVASATSPRTADTFTYAWTLTRNSFAYTPASGTVLNTAALNFTPGQPGLYVANCTFTDIDGAVSSQRTSSIQVTTVSPTLSITPAPSSLAEGTALSLTASATSPRTGDTFTYTWALTLNNAPFTPINGTILNAAALNFTPLQPGTYVATCTVTDLDGASASLSTPSIPVTAVSPLVVVTGAPITSAEGTQLNLSVSASSPRSNDTFSYVWSITRNNSNYTPASGTILNAANLHFTPGQPGAYIATCTITDIDGAVGSQSSSSITVTSVSPGVTLSGAPGSSVGEGTPINLLATPTSPRTNDTYSYAWTVTKNAQPYTLLNSVSTSNASFSFTPNTDGTYIANVVVTDLDSATRTVSTSPITVANVPPTVTIQNLPGSAISTGQSFSLTAHATEPGNGGYTYAWTVNGAQLPLSTSQTFSGTAQLSGAYNVVLTVTDAEGGVGTATGIITVSDLAPTATITGAPSTTPEGTAITLASTASDPGTQFGETFTYLWTVTRNGSSYPVTSATASNFTFTPNEYGNYVTTLTVTDSQGTATATTANITVTDVTPTSTLAAVPTAVRGMGVTFAGTVADPGTADGETIAWNYGDGTTQTFASTAANAMNPTHAYVAAGTYTATMTVTDSGGLSTTSTQSVSVVGAEVAADPFSAGKTALLVGGTTGSDSIKFYSETGGRVKVTLDGASIGLFAPTGHIVVEGVGSGSDTISIDAAIKLPAVLYGNAGTDSLYGGGGNNILIAGTGNDSLFAGPGADILIGGNGKDTLTGGAGNDLLVGGNWPFATNQSTLAAIDAQWTRTDESFATIVHQLRGVQAGSLAPSTLISTSNVTNSNGEFLICGSGRDWLLPVGGDVVEGFITSKDVESGGAVSLAHARHRPKKL